MKSSQTSKVQFRVTIRFFSALTIFNFYSINIDVSGYHTLGLTPASEIFIHFHNTSTATLVEADALKLAGGLSFIKIPKGLGDTIYFNYISTSASTVEVRVVKM